MARTRRPFNPKALRRYAVAAIRPQLGPETLVHRYTVLVPVEQIKAGESPRAIATADDLQNLQFMLTTYFGGVTLSRSLRSVFEEAHEQLEKSGGIPHDQFWREVEQSEPSSDRRHCAAGWLWQSLRCHGWVA